MKELKRNIKIIAIVFVSSFVFLIGYFSYAIYFYGGRWFESSYNVRIQSEKQKVITGDILDRRGVPLATTKFDKQGKQYREYNKSIRSVSHVVGYDNPIYGRSGAEAYYIQYLLGFNNNAIEKVYQALFLTRPEGNDVILTVDLQLQKIASQAMGNNKGAVILMNPKTGEILALVSKPDFDANQMINDIEGTGKAVLEKDNKLFNRATQGQYAPGSIFKIITAASALQYLEGIKEQKFNCEGFMLVNGNKIIDYEFDLKKKAHGEINFSQALIESCNITFATIGLELGRDKLRKTAEDFGFNQNFIFKDLRMNGSSFKMPPENKKDELAWDAVGQGNDIVSPLHMAMMISSVANHGIMMEPKLVKAVKNIRGYEFVRLETQAFQRTMSPDIANQLKNILLDVVSKGTGKAAQINNIEIAGKTGTAEVGIDAQKPHAWFVGFVNEEKHPLSIAVVMENAGTGGSKAAPVARTILKEAIRLGY